MEISNNAKTTFLSRCLSYNCINNTLGWLCFAVAAITYLLTIEPTASFWDCPEFISQGYKLEVGHPPGNPIFILTARFFINFAGSDPASVAKAVNVMSALLSAGTILLLFWTITYLMRRLLTGRGESVSAANTIVIMASGLVGALLYTWSDTFWYSAVEGEVYAFSSFCTALVVWLALKWDNRAGQPHADRYLVLIAYVIGISIAVHLLNLLTIPALALIVYFRLAKKPGVKNMLLTLLGSFAIVGVILYGLVPGFIENAGYFEIFFVNTLGMSYNVGVLIYTLIMFGTLIWCIAELYAQKSNLRIRLSFFLVVLLSGIPLIGNSWWVPTLFILVLGLYLWRARKTHVRPMLLTALSVLVIFVGYSSYALILIRANANPPMNQNSPDNVFVLSSYLNREQYGDTPLLYGPAFTSTVAWQQNADGSFEPMTNVKHANYGRVVKNSPDEPDRYVELEEATEYEWTPKMIFPRMYSQGEGHPEGYQKWIGETVDDFVDYKAHTRFDKSGNPIGAYEDIPMPTMTQNLRYFFDYQLGYMYWRYFMWNFAGRQNDLQGRQGEVTRGNWISGIPLIDNIRLGDQSLLPDELGEGNKGHNVFYMLPLLLGLLGIAAQLLHGEKGVKQFWIVFLLFFMTGIAIVLYLNQYPGQPRERDYAFAGSFYAFSIWIGLGVYTVYAAFRGFFSLFNDRKVPRKNAVAQQQPSASENRSNSTSDVIFASVAAVLCLLVPLQMVSQTWDDHDRSDRYTARDYGMNYLSSLDENAIIFTCGDNDTFPLWYAQEVEGYRTDVRVVNLAYLSQDWYANHTRMPAYNAMPVDFSARPVDYAYNRLSMVRNAYYSDQVPANSEPTDALRALADVYRAPDAWDNSSTGMRVLRFPNLTIPANATAAAEAGIIAPEDTLNVGDKMNIDWSAKSALMLSDLLPLDIIATSAKNGWNRPVYFAVTVPNSYYLNMENYFKTTGLAHQVTPINNKVDNTSVNAVKMYENVVNKFRWGGLDDTSKDVLIDDANRNMISSHRHVLTQLAYELYYLEEYEKAAEILDLILEKLPERYLPLPASMVSDIGNLYIELGDILGDNELTEAGNDIYERNIQRLSQYIPYLHMLMKQNKVYNILDLPVDMEEKIIPVYLYQTLNAYDEVNHYACDKLLDVIDERYPDYKDQFADLIEASSELIGNRNN